MCFFVPGHGKNDVDRLFARISHAFNNQDVFGSEKLQELIQNTITPTGVCLPVSNQDIVNWKNLLGMKYTSFKGIKSYRDFLIKRNAKGEVVVNYKECCYIGDYDYASLLKNDANSGLDLMTKTSEYTYRKKGLSSKLSQDKVNDLVKMYDRFIDPSFRPDWLPISQSILVSSVSDFLPSAGSR